MFGQILRSCRSSSSKSNKSLKDFVKSHDFKDINFPVKTRGNYKIEKNNSIGLSVFGYENKVKYPVYE